VRRKLTILGLTIIALVVILASTGAFLLRGSLPRLDGKLELAGLDSPVTVERDSLGVPTINAATRADAATALGFLHAQDRFFQMDLLRRSAAGELAGLFGAAALELDRDNRRHRFRHRAAAVIDAASPRDRKLIQAYVIGVNAGIEDLRVRPFEYLALRQSPRPWVEEDTILVLYSMFLDLSLSTAYAEATEATVHDTLPAALAAFLLPESNRWEAPLQNGGPAFPRLPDAMDIDLRASSGESDDEHLDSPASRRDAAGSNNWAVAGRLSGHGGALLANDMHLGLSLPNIWYRARTRWQEGDATHSTIGVTLPGTPALITGSNGHVAWGFTNSYGDWVDLVVLETNSAGRYLTPDGWEELESIEEIIEVAGAEPETLLVEQSRWGPVWTTDARGRPLALRWTAHDTEGANLKLLELELSTSVEDLIAIAGTLGLPQQNLVCADSGGTIAWTIAGRIPRRFGWDGRLPVSWADGSHGWQGYLEPDEQPNIIDPEEGRLWTANNRVTANGDLALIGQGGYALGARARQIRDGLRALDKPLESDMLALQLDDRAVYLEEWRGLALETLAAHRDGNTIRVEFERLITGDWDGHASIGSAGYRLVRTFNIELVDAVYAFLTANCLDADPGFNSRWLLYRHAVVWELVNQQPMNLLPPDHASWDSIILASVDRAMEYAMRDGRPAAEFVWGDRNTTQIAHPFTLFAPQLSRWLMAPSTALPGSSFLPRVQHSTSGASERLIVSPGREEDGIFHMPGGQSGHPLSRFFLAGHDAWEEGRATPLLPGKTEYRLELVP